MSIIDYSFFDSLKNYLLIDSLSVSYTGLSGKAGAALTLFELSRKDSFLENYAFEIFKESLVFLNNDFSYKGTVGVGLILNYLIDNKLIDADFEELFGESHRKIVQQALSGAFPTVNVCDLLLYFLLSNKITDSNDACIQALLSNLPNENAKIQRNWNFIATHFAMDKRLRQPVKVPQVSDSNFLIDQVDRLFHAIYKKNDTDDIIHNIVSAKLNFMEPDFNLALSRLLLLRLYPNQIPPRLLFFFY